MNKQCGRCDKVFPLDKKHFYWNSKKKHFHVWCKQCCIEMSKKRDYRPAKNRTRPLAKDPDELFFIKMRARLVRLNSKYSGEVVSTRYLLDLYEGSNSTCFYTGLEYLLTEEEPLSCAAERIDPTIGYVEGNVVLCCLFVSLAKGNWFLEKIKPLWVYLPNS